MISIMQSLLDQIEINGSNVLADRGYDSNKLLDYVYAPRWRANHSIPKGS